MITRSVLRRWAVLITFAYLIPALACNFPFPTTNSNSLAGLQTTLTALATAATDEQNPDPVGGTTPTPPLVAGEITATPSGFTGIPLQTPIQVDSGSHFIYYTQTGDTLPAVARRFAVEPEQISFSQPIEPEFLLPPKMELLIPNTLDQMQFADFLLPDSEIILSPSSTDFQIGDFIDTAGGYLSMYSEVVKGQMLSGTQIVQKVAEENSINSRLLLALLEYQSGWVYGEPVAPAKISYPIGFNIPEYKGLYYELVLAATHLGVGYYGWRTGALTSLTFPDGSRIRLSPGLNAGTVALQNFFAKLSDLVAWRETLYGADSFVSLHQQLYGDPWRRDSQAGPIFPPGLSQPGLELPFAPGERWSFTGGPHLSWNSGSPRGAIDFSPATGEAPCTTSKAWVTASAPGLVTRSADNVVAIDLDGDGHEGTGWVLIYLHIANQDSISPDEQVKVDQKLGHPSCERGNSTGTNVHIARKYNGEWIGADGSVPFILSGWEVEAGQRSYQGQMIKNEKIVSANPGGPSSSIIMRED